MNDIDYRQWADYYKNETKMYRCIASVHLEADDDKIFWSKIFTHFLPQYKFNYITYTRTTNGNKATGCKTCLKYHQLGCLSKDFFICIDSDYRYLLQEKDIDIKHYIFQTYTYSFENHYCYSKNIENVFSKLGLNNDMFNVKDFLEAISKSLYQPFIYHLLSIKKADGLFSESDFNSLINAVIIKNLNQSQIISELKAGIDRKVNPLKKKYRKSEIQSIENEYSQLGLTAKNIYLYCRGHNMFPLIIKLTKTIYKELETMKIQSYTNNERKAYFSQTRKPIEDCLKEDIHFDRYSEIDKIKADTKIYEKL